jgi:outer membrane protein assembly factor BamC
MLSTELLRRVSRVAMSAVVTAALLAGCESMNLSLGKKIDYKSSGSAPALEVPPDLTTPAYDDRYQVSTASGVAAARAAGRSTELLPVSSDARLARSGSERWLVVKTTQEAAWATLRDFWTKNGFVIAVEQPALGIMETDWAENRADLPKDFLQRFTSTTSSAAESSAARNRARSRFSSAIAARHNCRPSFPEERVKTGTGSCCLRIPSSRPNFWNA